MASTSTFPDAELIDAAPRNGRRAARRAQARRERSSKAREARLSNGFPDLIGMMPVMLFMLLPAAMAVGIALTPGGWPPELLYPLAGVMGLFVAFSTFRGVELVLACMIFYLPFSTSYAIPIAPGVNGTNMLLMLGLFAAILRAASKRQFWLAWPKGTMVIFSFGALTALSGLTIALIPGGYEYFVYSEILNYKAWLDQFVFYFIVLSCVRDGVTAKRVFVYLCIGSIILVIYAVPEMLDKMGRSTIEKSRIGGPHQQANNFGGFVAYTLLPVVALFVTWIRDWRSWFLVPYFLIAAKVLITTFSRGAYIAIAFGALMAGYFKGRGFIAFWLSLVVCFFLVFPGFLPESVMVRFDSIVEDQTTRSSPEELDKSSQTRLILWRAGALMIAEDPLLGKGFKGFKFLKSQYTEEPVFESDPHSMYLYVAAQMGLPALALFLLILAWSFQLGRQLSRDPDDRLVKAIGIGGASLTACYAAVCLFGSRAVNLEFTSYFWAYFVVMQVLRREQLARQAGVAPTRKRRTAFTARHEERMEAAREPEQLESPAVISARRSTRRRRQSADADQPVHWRRGR